MKIGMNLFNNMGIKVLAVAISVSLWFYVTYRGQSEMVIEAPVELKNMPKGLELLKQDVKGVSVRVSGNERFLKALRPMDTRVAIDLSRAKKGESTYYVDRDDITIPPSIKVLRIDPNNVRLTIDESISKVVPVEAVVVGVPRRGYRIRSVRVTPGSVLLEGARTEVEKVSVIRTEPVDVRGLASDLNQAVRVNIRENLRAKVSEVSVRITIGR